MADASSFLTSRDCQDELRKQGRIFFTNTGKWSPQGFADDIPPTAVYNGYWPEGELNSDWGPCDSINGGTCKPYGNGEIVSALREWDEGVGEWGNMILTEKGAWAPKIIQNLVEMGLDMGVWNVNSPESCFVTMCSVCGSCIVKSFDDGTDPDGPKETLFEGTPDEQSVSEFIGWSEWTSFFG